MQAAAISWGCLGGMLAVLFVVRRFAGALQCPLDGPQLLALGALVAMGSVAMRLPWASDARSSVGPRRNAIHMAQWSYSLAVFGFAAALSLRGSAIWGNCMLWVLTAMGEIAALWLFYRRIPLRRLRSGEVADGQRGEGGERGCGRPPGGLVPFAPSESGEEPRESGEGEEDALLPDGVWQQLTRARVEDGRQVVYGTLRCEFERGQRTTVAHVAFCPPLPSIPDLTADPLCGPPTTVRATLVEAFGASIEVKRTGPGSERACVQIQLFASEPLGDASTTALPDSASAA